MHFLTLISIRLSTIDSYLGKVDKLNLSEQTLMELLIEGVNTKEAIFRSYKENADIAHWIGVSADGSGNVCCIEWIGLELSGTIDLRWLPLALTHLEVCDNYLQGSINLTELPGVLQEFLIRNNEVSGSICLTQLPDVMEVLDLSRNRLNGSLKLTQLSPSMKMLNLSSNEFQGSIDLTNLPQGIILLLLNDNPIEGKTDFSQLPDSLIQFGAQIFRGNGLFCQENI